MPFTPSRQCHCPATPSTLLGQSCFYNVSRPRDCHWMGAREIAFSFKLAQVAIPWQSICSLVLVSFSPTLTPRQQQALILIARFDVYRPHKGRSSWVFLQQMTKSVRSQHATLQARVAGFWILTRMSSTRRFDVQRLYSALVEFSRTAR
jgi:hypothetical protein